MDSDMTLSIARGHIDPNSRLPYDFILREQPIQKTQSFKETERAFEEAKQQHKYMKAQSASFTKTGSIFEKNGPPVKQESGLLNFFKKTSDVVNPVQVALKPEIPKAITQNLAGFTFKMKSGAKPVVPVLKAAVVQPPSPIDSKDKSGGVTTDESTPVKKDEDPEQTTSIPESEANPKKRKFEEFKESLTEEPELQQEPKAVKQIKKNSEETITPTKMAIDLSKYTYASGKLIYLQLDKENEEPQSSEVIEESPIKMLPKPVQVEAEIIQKVEICSEKIEFEELQRSTTTTTNTTNLVQKRGSLKYNNNTLRTSLTSLATTSVSGDKSGEKEQVFSLLDSFKMSTPSAIGMTRKKGQ